MDTYNSLIALDSFIESHSREIRGLKIIPDIDLADLFGVSLHHIHQSVIKNMKCFPDDFMLILSPNELQQKYCKRFAFTESGIFMLASIIKSRRATKIIIELVKLLIERKPGIAFKLLQTK